MGKNVYSWFWVVTLIIVGFCFPTIGVTKTYEWGDYSKPFNKEIRLGSAEIELNLPEGSIERLSRIPLVVSYRRPYSGYYISLRVNDQPRGSEYLIGKTKDSTDTVGSEKIVIDSKYLKRGQNTLHFHYETNNPAGFWYIDLTALKFELVKPDNDSSVTAKKNSQGAYQWKDYSKPFDKEFRLTGSVEIDVDLPEEIVENNDQIPLAVSYRRKSTDFYISLKVNDQSRWSPYLIGKKKGSPSMAGTDTVRIDKKYLKPGSNRLIFEFETKSPSMWYLDVTAISFGIQGTENGSSLVAKKGSKSTYKWSDYSKPFDEELRFGPKAKVVEFSIPEDILKKYKQIGLIVKHSGLGDANSAGPVSRSLDLSVNEHATSSGYEFGKRRSWSSAPLKITIDTKFLKPGTNKLRFQAQNRSFGGWFSIFALSFDLSDSEKSDVLIADEGSSKEDGKRIFKWDDFRKPFKKRLPEIKPMLPVTIEVYLPEQFSAYDEVALIIDTVLSYGNAFTAKLYINNESEWRVYRFKSPSKQGGQRKIMIKGKDLKPGLNKILIKGRGRFDIVGMRFDIPGAIAKETSTFQSSQSDAEGKQTNTLAGVKQPGPEPEFIGAADTAPANDETAQSKNGTSVEFPKMGVGDAWTLDTAFGLEHYKVIKINSDGGFIIEKREEKTRITFQLHFDNEYRLVKKLDVEANQRHKIDEPPARYLDFPLHVGKKWEDKYFGWTLSRTRTPREMECTYLVEKMEQIETGIGKINTFKINRWFRNSSYATIDRESYWYSPKLKAIIKTDPIVDKGAELRSYRPAIDNKKMAINKRDDSQVLAANKKDASPAAKIKEPEVKKTPPKVVEKAQPPPAVQHPVASVRWAVVIGVSNYQDTRIPSLRYANKDAQSFYNWLISPKGGKYALSRVKLLVDDNATAIGIRNSLFEWLGQALEEDVVTIFFAGHGSPQSPDNPDNLFLLPFDTNYDSVATTGFPMWDIETALKRFIRAKKVVVIADACHSGGVGQAFDVARRASRGVNAVSISSNLQNLTRIGDGICIISASDDSQYSQESKKWGGGHGVFTYYLLRGLKGEADYSKDHRVTLGEIVPYLSEQVRRATRNAQSPTVAGRFDPALTIGK